MLTSRKLKGVPMSEIKQFEPKFMPIGVLTAVVGTPCFIWLLSRAQRQT